MAEYIDILLDEDGDLAVSPEGDFVTGPSLEQEIGLILQLAKGRLPINPTIGPGIMSMLNSEEGAQKIRQKIKLHCEADGIKNVKVTIVDGKIKVEGERL